MPTVLTHPAIALAARVATGGQATSRRLLLAGVIATILPDLDAIGYLAGVPYGSLLGHRGLTHSLAFALLLALCALPLAGWLRARRGWAFGLIFLATASHGLLDAMTDDGLGVAFLSPFSDERFFFPWRPIPAAPIGFTGVFSPSELHIFGSELRIVWLPCFLLALAARAALRQRGRRGAGRPAWRTAVVGAAFALSYLLAGELRGSVNAREGASPRAARTVAEGIMLSEAIANLERQAAVLALHADPACPQDYAALETGRPLRISLFYGYDEHDGKVRDRANAGAMARILTGDCRDRLSACGFAPVSGTGSATRLERTIDGRQVELALFTSSLADAAAWSEGLVSAYREQERLSRSVKERFLHELVESDIVFFMGHSRLGGSIGFEDESGITTAMNSVLRLPLRPVIEALERRPTRLRILGMFSCDSNRYFRTAFQAANPALSLILTTGDIRYGPAEQASLGALEAILSKNCGSAVRASLITVDEPDPTMTFLARGR